MYKNILYYLFISFLLVFVILFFIFLNHIENYIEIINYVNKYFSNI